MKVNLVVNSKKVVLNNYVQRVFTNIIVSLVKTLKGVSKKIKHIQIEITI